MNRVMGVKNIIEVTMMIYISKGYVLEHSTEELLFKSATTTSSGGLQIAL